MAMLKRFVSQKVIGIDAERRENHWHYVAEFDDGTIQETFFWRGWDSRGYEPLPTNWQPVGQRDAMLKAWDENQEKGRR